MPPSELTANLLRDATDAKTWERGVGYFQDGRVVSAERRSGWVYGTVAGSSRYRCKLRVAGKGLAFDCDCPMGADRVLCKHVVATGLAYIDNPGDPKRAATLADVQRYLEALAPDALVRLVMDRLDQDDDWREALVRTAAVHRPEGVDLAQLKRAITKATRAESYVDYYAAGSYADGVASLCDPLAELIAIGHADPAIELIEYALERCEDALGRVDDSNGEVSGVLNDLQDLHLRACQHAENLRPQKLAKRLFDWRMSTDWDTFYNAPETYAEVLGKKGLARFRELTEKQWQALPALGPGDDRFGFDAKRFTLTALMENLARLTGDVDELIRVRQNNLSSPYHFLKIAETCLEHGRLGEATDWAQRGVNAFPEEQRDTRLHAFLVELYQKAGRRDDAVQLAWSLFDLNPGLHGYTRLKSHAEQVRVNGRKSKTPWKQWRERALARLREDIAQAMKLRPHAQAARYATPADAGHSRLVEVFLWEEDVDSAWQEAQSGGCSGALWLRLAKQREATQPADAVAVYQEFAADCIERTNKRGYQEGVALIERLLPLMQAAGMDDQRRRYLTVLRESYKRKRTFIQMLDAVAQ